MIDGELLAGALHEAASTYQSAGVVNYDRVEIDQEDIDSLLELADRVDGGGDAVAIDAEAARAALHEVDTAIERTGGGSVGADEACSPLAALRRDVRDEPELDEYSRGYVLQAINEIAEERGVDASGADPLVDATFRARSSLQEALDEPDDDTDEDSPQTELSADGGWEVTD